MTTLALAVAGCSQKSPDEAPNTIGRAPVSYSAPYLWGDAHATNEVIALDAKNHTLQTFSLNPFNHERSLDLPFGGANPGVIASADGGYFVVTSDKDFAVMKPDGQAVIDPIEVVDGVTSVAFAPEANLLVLTDDFHSMALMQLSATGDIQASLRKGNVLADGQSITTGTMMSDGRLVLFSDDSGMAVIDTGATITAGDWQKTTATVAGSTGISWAAAAPEAKDTVLAMDGSHLFSLNVATGAVTDSLDLKGATILGQFRDYSPHVVVADATEGASGVAQIYNVGADGKIAKHTVHGTAGPVSRTLYDASTAVLTVLYTDSLYRFRLSDNLAMDVSAVEQDATLIPTPNYLLTLFPSTLGLAERRTYGAHPAVERREGYNLKTLTDTFK